MFNMGMKPDSSPEIENETLYASAGTLARRYDMSRTHVGRLAAAGIFPRLVLGTRCTRYPVAECDAAMAALVETASASTQAQG